MKTCPICMNAYEAVSCPCDYRIKNLASVNLLKIEEQEPKIEEANATAKFLEWHAEVVKLAVTAEREACAAMCDETKAARLAEKIRARGNT